MICIDARGIIGRTLCDETVKVLVVWSLNSQVAAANVVNGLVVDHEGAVGVLESCVRGENRVVWLNNRSGDLRGGINTELELALLSIVNGQTLHQQGTETRASSTTKRVEDQETLQSGAVVGDTSDLVQDLINELLSHSVVTTGVIV